MKKYKFIILSIITITIFNIDNVFAENFDANVTIKPSLTLDISSNRVSMDLDPASKTYDEKDLVVSVGTNNSYGYKLYVSSGNTDTSGNITTNLINIADNTKTIPNITSTYPLSSMPVNSWGYRLTNNSTISTGDYGVFTSGSIVSESDKPVNNNISTLGFASKIDYTMPSGTYELTLNFKALPIVTQYYMQDLGKDLELANKVCAEDPTIVIDKRDEQAYTIRRINGTCWMVDNLRFTGTELDYTTSNVANSYTPDNPYRVNSGSGYYDVVDNEKCFGQISNDQSTGWGDGYDYSCATKGSNDYSNGNTVWYNYAAASAGTITGVNNPDTQSYDICPAGWKLPNNNNIDSIVGSGYLSSFNINLAGQCSYGGCSNVGANAYWWGSNSGTAVTRNRLGTDNKSLYRTTYYTRRTIGSAIRCVLQ